MSIWKVAIAATVLLSAGTGHARPVSWPGGWTAIGELDPMMGSALLHYTPNRHWSLGARVSHMRESEWTLTGAQATWIAKRWNMPGAQANIYLSGLAGGAWEDGGPLRPAGFAELQADWENRRVMVMGMARITHADGIETADMQMARLGWAPYAGDYGDVHLWLFGQVMRDSGSRDRVQPALVARIFYRTMLLEAGITDRGGLILNSTLRF
jgi:hypothetical protein